MPEPNRGAPRWLNASEVGRYAYCARAWYLERIAGARPSNRQAVRYGRHHHRAHGRLVGAAQRQARLAQALFWLTAGLALALALSFLGR